MEALYRMESLCSEAFFGRCRRLVRFIALFRPDRFSVQERS